VPGQGFAWLEDVSPDTDLFALTDDFCFQSHISTLYILDIIRNKHLPLEAHSDVSLGIPYSE
jgi:hypothetical protein